jgi:hypothetical protein
MAVQRPLLAPIAIMLVVTATFMFPAPRCVIFGLNCEENSVDEQRHAPKPQAPVQITHTTRALPKPAQAAIVSPKTMATSQESEFREDHPKTAESEPQELQKSQEAQEALQHSRLYDDARKCAAANPCLAQVCYAEILKQHTGAQAVKFQKELMDVRKACSTPVTTPLPDGVYSARALAGCGASQQFAIRVEVRGIRIGWQHDAPLAPKSPVVPVQWNGTIDQEGNILATVGNSEGFIAKGKFDGRVREVEMHYPNCNGQTITLSISGRRIE